MGRLLAAAPARNRGGTECSVCKWIDSLDGEDREDAEVLWANQSTYGHVQAVTAIEAVFGVVFNPHTFGGCRRRRHRGTPA